MIDPNIILNVVLLIGGALAVLAAAKGKFGRAGADAADRLVKLLEAELAAVRHRLDESTQLVRMQATELRDLRASRDLTPVLERQDTLIDAVKAIAESSLSRHGEFAQHLSANSQLLKSTVKQLDSMAKVLDEVARHLKGIRNGSPREGP